MLESKFCGKMPLMGLAGENAIHGDYGETWLRAGGGRLRPLARPTDHA
jgi:hypothetical protein